MAKFDAEVAAAIAHWAPFYGVTIDPAVVHGIIQQESSNGRVLSTLEPDGDYSYGPMMVKAATARTELGVADPASLKDNPALGIYYGVQYFAKQLKRFAGDVAAAVSAYNTGAGHAKRSARTGKFPNQSYVDRVFGFAKQYAPAIAGASIALVFALLLFLRARGGRR